TDLLARSELRAELQGGGDADRVTGQSPPMGTAVPLGSTVSVYVGHGVQGGLTNAKDQTTGHHIPTLVYVALAGVAVLVVLVALVVRKRTTQTAPRVNAATVARENAPRDRRKDQHRPKRVTTQLRKLAPIVRVHDDQD